MLCLDYPGNRIFFGRKVGKHFKATTLQTWYDTIPTDCYTENKSEQTITIKAGKHNSVISYGGLNNREELDKFTSAEYGAIAIDQAEELEEGDFLALLPRLRLKLPATKKYPDGRVPHYRALFTANPKQCYFRQRYITETAPGRQFIQALPSDNPYLPPDYIDRLKDLYKNRPELLKALVEGSWDILEGINTVIRQKWAEQCTLIQDVRRYHNKAGVSCDPARFGDDETVIYGWQGTKQVRRDVFGKKDEDYVASRCLAMLREVGGNWIAVGGGAIAEQVKMRLRKLIDADVIIIEVNEGMPADNPKKYYNIRAEMYWEAGEMMSDSCVGLMPDNINIAQLTAHTYTFSNGRILIDPKDEVKIKIGRSPDFADATVIGLWGMKHAPDLPTMQSIGKTSTQKWVEKRQMELSGSRASGSYFDAEGVNYLDDNDTDVE